MIFSIFSIVAKILAMSPQNEAFYLKTGRIQHINNYNIACQVNSYFLLSVGLFE
jgi:hypothetical protein